MTRSFLCWDADTSSVDAVEIVAESALDAARAYVDGRDWSVEDSTIWIDVRVAELPRVPDEPSLEHDSRHRIAVDPLPTLCLDEDGRRNGDHSWSDDVRLVGGLRENPGVFGWGGGVVIHRICTACGCGEIVNTWATDPATGESGLRSTTYQIDRMNRHEIAELLAGD